MDQFNFHKIATGLYDLGTLTPREHVYDKHGIGSIAFHGDDRVIPLVDFLGFKIYSTRHWFNPNTDYWHRDCSNTQYSYIDRVKTHPWMLMTIGYTKNEKCYYNYSDIEMGTQFWCTHSNYHYNGNAWHIYLVHAAIVHASPKNNTNNVNRFLTRYDLAPMSIIHPELKKDEKRLAPPKWA